LNVQTTTEEISKTTPDRPYLLIKIRRHNNDTDRSIEKDGRKKQVRNEANTRIEERIRSDVSHPKQEMALKPDNCNDIIIRRVHVREDII
jgi:hypothetical protein